MVITERFSVETKGDGDVIDITPKVAAAVRGSKLKSGIVTVFVVGSTVGISTLENESGLISDLQGTFERVIPQGLDYRHNRRWGEGNAHSHLRASLWGCSLTVPFEGGNLLLGTWQQIMLLDFDTRPRSRQIILQIMGE